MGVASCGCPISDNVVPKTMAYLDLIKRAAHLALEYDAMAFLINFEMVRIAPLLSLESKF